MADNMLLKIGIGIGLAAGSVGVVGRIIKDIGLIGKSVDQLQGRKASVDQWAQQKQAASEAAKMWQEAARAQRAGNGSAEAVQKAQAAFRREAEALRELKRSLAEVGVSTKDVAQAQVRLGAAFDKVTGQMAKMNALNDRMGQIQTLRADRRGQLIDAFALTQVIKAPVNAAIEFESVMADVKKVVDFDNPQQFGQMGQDILKMSTVIPMSASGLGQIVAEAARSGIAKNELTRFAEEAAKMGVAFDMSAEEAGQAMTGMRTLFGLNQDQVGSLGDAYNHLSNNLGGLPRDMLNIANRVGSTARMVGLSGEQLGALSTTMLAMKTAPEVAATGLNTLLQRMADAPNQNADFQDGLKDIGMSATELKTAMEDDAQGALINFLTAIKGSEDQIGTLSKLFGAEYTDDMAKLVNGMDTYQKALGLIGDKTAYAGSMNKEYQARSETTANALQLLGNSVERLGVNLGSVLLPGIRIVADFLGTITNVVAEAAAEYPRLTTVISGLFVGFAALKIGVIAGGYALTFFSPLVLIARKALLGLQIVTTLTSARFGLLNLQLLLTRSRMMALAIGSGIQAFGSALMLLARGAIPAVITGLRLLTIGLLTNPIGWLVMGIAAAAGLIIANWSEVKTFLLGLWEPIKPYFESFIAFVQPLMQPVINMFDGLFSTIGKITGGIGAIASSAGNFLGLSTSGVEVPDATPNTGLPPAIAGSTNSQNVNVSANINLNVTGVSPEIARKIAEEEIEKANRRIQARLRNGLHD